MTKAVRLFMDTEFTGLHQNAQLISIGIIAQDDATFYAEFDNIDLDECNPWIKANVVPGLKWSSEGGSTCMVVKDGSDVEVYDSTRQIVNELTVWLAQWERVEIWCDCGPWDWVLFTELFGGGLNIQKHVFYTPFDLATALKLNGVDPDVNREEFADMTGTPQKHNALWDARVLRECHAKLAVLSLIKSKP